MPITDESLYDRDSQSTIGIRHLSNTDKSVFAEITNKQEPGSKNKTIYLPDQTNTDITLFIGNCLWHWKISVKSTRAHSL